MFIIAILLMKTAIAVLSADDVKQSVYQPFKDDKSVCIAPDGPLNLVYGYTYHNSELAPKMRLISPAFEINYTLTKSDDGDIFDVDNNKDGINKFEGDKKTTEYLYRYYRMFKEMFNVTNGEVKPHTGRKSSFFMFLTQKLDKPTRFRLFASMILLAEGVDVPLKFEDRNNKDFKNERKGAPVLVCRYGETESFFEIELHETVKVAVKNQDGAVTGEKDGVHKFKEVINLINFFINHGGSNVEKLKTMGLTFNETPRFLIHAYVFELMEDVDDARQLFGAVRGLLKHTGNGEESEKWKLFFARNEEAVVKYDQVFKVYQMVDELIFDRVFPFSAYNQPPSNMVVNAYNRGTGKEVKGLNFSDCTNITIYSLFCCLFYSPNDRKYKLDHLKDNEYTPSRDLSKFFEVDCPVPVKKTTQDLHQKWTHVIQDLVLSEGELRGEEASESNTIVYRKEAGGVNAEVKTELLNVLKIVAKVTGMPKERMQELYRINSMVQDAKANWNDLCQRIEDFATKVIEEISVMPVKVSFHEMRIEGRDGFRGVYGTTKLNFTSINIGNSTDTLRTIMLTFNQGHGKATMNSNTLKVISKIKNSLNELISKCEGIEEYLWNRMKMRVDAFLKKGKLEPFPPEVVKEIEEASDELGRYLAINRILVYCCPNIPSSYDKLYIVDLFRPYLEKATAKEDTDREVAADVSTDENMGDDGNLIKNPHDSILLQNLYDAKMSGNETIKPKRPKAQDPVVQLISNIMGTTPLVDEFTQFLFIQTFAFCNGEHKRLFPNISGDFSDIIQHPFTDFALIEGQYEEHYFLNQLWHFPAPNTLSRLWRTLRALHGEAFFDQVIVKESAAMKYYRMVKTSLETKCSAAIESINKDLKIKDGLIEPGSGAFTRAAFLFSVLIGNEFPEGIEIVCNSWKEICKEDNYLFILLRGKLTDVFYWNERLSDEFKEEIYKNEDCEKILMEIYRCFSITNDQFDEAHSLFETSSYKHSLFEVIYNSLENNIRNIFDHAQKMLKSEYPKDSNIFFGVIGYIDALLYFINLVEPIRKETATELHKEGIFDSIFEKTFDEINGWLSKTTESLLIISDQLSFKEDSEKFKELIDKISACLATRGKLDKMKKVMEWAYNRYIGTKNPEKSDEIIKLLVEICNHLVVYGNLDKLDELLMKVCNRLSAQNQLIRINDVLKWGVLKKLNGKEELDEITKLLENDQDQLDTKSSNVQQNPEAISGYN